jgi:TM2 domain-containing membrane protein YozV
MNCANHVDVPATAYCRTCGKPVCSICARDVRGVIYCEDCLASQVSGTMPPQPGPGVVAPGAPAVSGGSPGLAALLGFIPGVGAMYNGEYGKGFIHVLIFATLIWAANNVSPLFGLAIAAFVIYMPIEAYQTAKARELGLQPPDPFGFNNIFSGRAPVAAAVPPTGVAPGTVAAAPLEGRPVEEDSEGNGRIPVGAFILIGLGVLFLFNTFGWMHFDWLWRFWPVVLIAIGIRVLMRRNRMGY